MKISGKKWAIIGALLFVVAVVALYIPYNNQMKEQKSLEQSIMTAQQEALLLTINKSNLEKAIAKLQTDISDAEEESVQKQAELHTLEDELNRLKAERQQAVEEAIALLNATKVKFLSAVESIEYSEMLYTLADAADITLNDISASDTGDITIDDVKYTIVSFNLSVSGDRENILDFITKIQSDSAFKTAFFDQIEINTPQPLTDEEKTAIFDRILNELEIGAIEQFTVEDIVNFIVLAIKDVTKDDIFTLTLEQMATVIKANLGKLVAEDYKSPLADELAELINQHIADSLVNAIINPLAQEISDAITDGSDHNALVILFGKDIADLLGDQLAGMLTSDIANLLNTYISDLIAIKMMDHVEPIVFQTAQQQSEALIKELESASASNIAITLYSYQEAE